MKRLGAILLLISGIGCGRSSGPECDYTSPRCAPDRVCAFVQAGRSACIPFAIEEGVLAAPFAAGQVFACSQGGRSAAGRTHSFGGDLFAADLFSPASSTTVEIVSPVDGDAYGFDGCEERASDPAAHNDSRCGLGYGNHVKVWDGRNIHLFGHLARALVTRGRVRRGQVIGIEGVSGAAGSRHIHVAVTRPGPGEDLKELLETPGYKGAVPVRVRYRYRAIDQAETSAWVDELPCAEGMPPSYTAL